MLFGNFRQSFYVCHHVHKKYTNLKYTRNLCTRLDYRDCVLLSKAKDIYINLSFEDLLYKKVTFGEPEKTLLLMWYNEPAVVIGRHQNPWVECHVQTLIRKGVALARRNSGGGTVYHDLGNLNCSFFTSRKKYNRKANLEIISRALKKYWNIDSKISLREDLVIMDEYKISGTASKLGAKTAYHHCTVLVNINCSSLHQTLKVKDENITSKATSSVPSKIKNLKEVCASITIRKLADKIALEYQEHYGLLTTGPILINPSEHTMPGLTDAIKIFRSWDWIYGKTPRFAIHKSFSVPPDIEFDALDIDNRSITVEISVYHGIIEDIKLNNFPLHLECAQSLQECLKGEKLILEDVDFSCSQWITLNVLNEEMIILKFIVECIKETVKTAYS